MYWEIFCRDDPLIFAWVCGAKTHEEAKMAVAAKEIDPDDADNCHVIHYAHEESFRAHQQYMSGRRAEEKQRILNLLEEWENGTPQTR